MRRLIALAAALPLAACFTPPPDRLEGDAPPPVVDAVDLERYAGRWFEIARYDVSFQEGCTGVMAEYAIVDEGRLSVLNTCRKDALDGPVDRAEGRARVVGGNGAKLEVSFFGPFWGDYWVIELAEDYSWAVVSEPGGRYLWILSRTPQMDEAVLEARLSRLREIGYDTSALLFTEQWDSVEAAPEPQL